MTKKNNAKLVLNLIPATSWWKNARNKLKKSEWDTIRKKVYEQANYICEICGVNEQNYLGIKKGWLHCNEVWEYQENKQILVRLEAICRLCHLSQHMGFASVIGRDWEAKKHLKKVNNWSEEQAIIHIKEKFQEWEKRNKIEWVLDISFLDRYLKQGIKGDKSNQTSQIVKQKGAKKKDKLVEEYQECYTKNPHSLELAKKWEKAGIESWLNYEKTRKRNNKN